MKTDCVTGFVDTEYGEFAADFYTYIEDGERVFEMKNARFNEYNVPVSTINYALTEMLIDSALEEMYD